MTRLSVHLALSVSLNLTWMVYLAVSTDFWLPKDLCDSSPEFGAFDLFGSGPIGCFVNVDMAAWYVLGGALFLFPYSIIFGEATFFVVRFLVARTREAVRGVVGSLNRSPKVW